MRMASMEVEEGNKKAAIIVLDFVAKTSRPDCDMSKLFSLSFFVCFSCCCFFATATLWAFSVNLAITIDF